MYYNQLNVFLIQTPIPKVLFLFQDPTYHITLHLVFEQFQAPQIFFVLMLTILVALDGYFVKNPSIGFILYFTYNQTRVVGFWEQDHRVKCHFCPIVLRGAYIINMIQQLLRLFLSGFSLPSSSILYSLEGCHCAFSFDILSITVQFSKYFRMLQAHFVYLMPHWLTFHVAACFIIDLLINRFIEYSFLKLLCNLCSHLFSPSPSSNTSLFSVTKKSSEFSKKNF